MDAAVEQLLLEAGALVRFLAHPVATAAAAAALVAAAGRDLAERLLPDRLTLAVLAAGLLHLAPLGPAVLLAHLAVAGLVFLAGALLFGRSLVGGGDVKLGAAAALWAGPAHFPLFAATMSLTTLLLAGLLLLERRLAGGPHAALPTLPLGVAIAAAGLAVIAVRLFADAPQ
jgi:prepilin peptidase CpaA